MKLEITYEEHELLTEILEEHRRELLREIAKADHHEFKKRLRGKEQLLESVFDKLGRPATN
jgi:vacuolar-type H+-ATPase subunit E/Vma4